MRLNEIIKHVLEGKDEVKPFKEAFNFKTDENLTQLGAKDIEEIIKSTSYDNESVKSAKFIKARYMNKFDGIALMYNIEIGTGNESIWIFVNRGKLDIEFV